MWRGQFEVLGVREKDNRRCKEKEEEVRLWGNSHMSIHEENIACREDMGVIGEDREGDRERQTYWCRGGVESD